MRPAKSWWATKLPDNRWVVWTHEAIKDARHSTFEEAQESLLDPKSVEESKPTPAIHDIFVG